MLNFEAATLKFGNHFWKFGCQPWKSKANALKVLIYFKDFDIFTFALLTRVSLWGTIKSQINHNVWTVCCTEVCLTFLTLAAKLLEMIAKFRGHSLKIQNQSTSDLNGLKKGKPKYFENSLKSMHLFQRLMGAMNCR